MTEQSTYQQPLHGQPGIAEAVEAMVRAGVSRSEAVARATAEAYLRDHRGTFERLRDR